MIISSRYMDKNLALLVAVLVIINAVCCFVSGAKLAGGLGGKPIRITLGLALGLVFCFFERLDRCFHWKFCKIVTIIP